MKAKPIEGFKVLKFKEKMQARVQAELAGLSAQERIRKIREDVEQGPLGEWWRKMQEAQAVKQK